MTLNDLVWLFHDNMRFRSAILESERLINQSINQSINNQSIKNLPGRQLPMITGAVQVTQ